MSLLPPLTIFDVETTGLDPRKGHRIIEIAGIRIENGIILKDAPFISLVNPERDIPWEARQVNKISDDDVRSAPRIEEVIPKFLEFAKSSFLVAHNAQFDMSFLQAEREFCWGYVDLPECLCTMRLSQVLYPTEFRHSLDILCKRFELVLPQTRHRALTDVLLTAEILLKMVQAGGIHSLDELRQKAGLQLTTAR